MVASLAKRMVVVKTSMSELNGRVDESHQHLEELGSDFTKLREDFKSALNILGGNLGRESYDLRGMLMGEIMRIRGKVKEKRRSLHRELEDLRADVPLCKHFIASGGRNTSNIDPKVEVPKPSPFMGKREAREVNDFLWEMEQYMEGVNIVNDALKIKMATCYLKDTMALWWQRRNGNIELETKCRTKDPCRDKSMTSGIRASQFKVIANEGDRNVVGASGITVDENCGQEESRQGDKRSRGVLRHGSKLGQEDGGCQDIHVGVEWASR
uniref:Putative retrotransposon Gag domain, nucleotide-binding alpha-beta plait domain protein n=1 Tax=Tanacetum cinerariifolium TaxID=118510 RepID=A0A699L6I4_TANCI|nr:putative retrotransposon Gag domain, nucleotide-binding alpha-beta plait domain protein [Tanacetum cinerariifolium]